MAAFGQRLSGILAGWRWPVARTSRQEASTPRLTAPVEILPKWALFTPLTIQWLWLGLRHGSVTLPSVVNPAIETGGLVGESKREYLSLIGDAFHHLVATTAAVMPGGNPEQTRRDAGIDYPLVAKPDIGWCGFGVRRIDGPAELARYAAAFPPGETFLLQKYVTGREAAVFYIRHPDHRRGRVAALTLRHLPEVIGDGARSLSALIEAHPRLRRYHGVYASILGPERLREIPATGEIIRLATIASIRVGGRYEDGEHLVTPAFEDAIDGLSRSMGGFHYGRFDIKFESAEDLAQGRFTILEINGAGAEAIQYFDPKVPFMETFRGVFAKQRALFALADDMRRAGGKPIGWRALARAHLRQRRLIKTYPSSN